MRPDLPGHRVRRVRAAEAELTWPPSPRHADGTPVCVDDVVRPILMKGNEAMAEAAIQAGCDAYFGYPITPQAELLEWMARRMPELGRVFVQAESELAAINMALGAAATGARVLVSSSSPGISLMAEGDELPGRLRVARWSSSTSCVADRASAASVRRNPTTSRRPRATVTVTTACRCSRPSSIAEAVELTADAFEIAERYRTPVMILADGVMGQAMEPVVPVYRMPARTPGGWELSGAVDRPPRVVRSLHLRPEDLEAHNQHLQAKFAAIPSERSAGRASSSRTPRSSSSPTAPRRASRAPRSSGRAIRACVPASSDRSACGRSPRAACPASPRICGRSSSSRCRRGRWSRTCAWPSKGERRSSSTAGRAAWSRRRARSSMP